MVGADDLFLVSGGARGITAACVVGMARRFGCGFLLLGRTPLAPPPEWAGLGLDDAALKQRIAADITARGERPLPAAIQRAWRDIRANQEIAATLRAVQDAGGRARYLCADVADEAGLRAAIADVGPITGVIHGAGALADKRIEQKTGADFDSVLGPKIGGLRALLAVAPPGGLRHLVIFSSAAGFYGNLGQSDYAIANEILNKASLQLQRDHPACRVLSLNWGPWDGGMVTPAIKALFAQRQIDVIPVDGGVEVLLTALEADRPGVQLVVGSPMRAAPAPLAGELITQRSSRQLSVEANPFLADHMIGIHAVLPATAAASWMIDACQRLHPGYRLRRCDGLQVLKGVVFDEQLAGRYRLELKETAKDAPAGIVRLDALISSVTAEGRPRYHYRASIELGRAVDAPPTLAGLDLAERDACDGAALYADGTLFHGPSLRGVQRVLHIDGSGLTLRCALPALSAEAQGQFPAGDFNPFVADALFQSCLIWVRRTYDAASLPLGWASAEQYLPLAFDTPTYLTLAVREATEQRLVADIAAHDAAGRVALQLRGVEAAVSRQLNRLFAHDRATGSPR
ncbi:polyketide synthase dehydratase domain-containing protein [Oscillochloris sp. ZM17-4]|uniref:KR domain-containing protein n=1 Tax=Oscillochloris sp. ZM17-4 TaxID=2866714 RepID=UPI001C732FFD|nr:KR domain-containing protein [Oscillochloris sp. ZM17-4]MBX0328785.1 polyketide synthase dehydratase domain-containing protein [Oscillochloris sp. ZM17-4]